MFFKVGDKVWPAWQRFPDFDKDRDNPITRHCCGTIIAISDDGLQVSVNWEPSVPKTGIYSRDQLRLEL